MATYGDQLDRVVDQFGTKLDCLQQRLAAIQPAKDTQLVHGDVTAGNILVDDQLRPISVLDFGLLSMPGDRPSTPPAPRRSTPSGPHTPAPSKPTRRRTDRPPRLHRGHLLTYRAIHALLTGNAHDADLFNRDSAVPLTANLLNNPQYTKFLT